MQPSHAHVVKSIDLVAHKLSRARRFFRDGQVRGSRGDDQDKPPARHHVLLLERND